MNMQKKRTRGAFWGLLMVGPLLLPAALALSPLFLIPLSMWVYVRGQHSWEQRRSAAQKRNEQQGFVFVHAQRGGAQGTLPGNTGNSLDLSCHPQIFNVYGEVILLVFPSGEASRAKEYILSTLANFSDQTGKPEMIVVAGGVHSGSRTRPVSR